MYEMVVRTITEKNMVELEMHWGVRRTIVERGQT